MKSYVLAFDPAVKKDRVTPSQYLNSLGRTKVHGACLISSFKAIGPLVPGKKSFKRFFGEVEGAYWFGPVCLSVRLSVRNTFLQLRNSRTACVSILNLYMWHV